MTEQMIIRIDSELKTKVSRLAKAEGKSVSEMVRRLLEEYVRDRDISGYIDDLWNRIGHKLASKGATPADVQPAVKSVRSAP